MDASATTAHHPSAGLVLRRTIARVIDDGILTLLSVLIALAMIELLPAASDGYYNEATGDVPAPEALTILLTGLLATVLFLLYVGTAAGRQGATLGRVVAGIRVAGRDGRPLPGAVIFGRELMRVALVCLSLALVFPVAGLLGSSVQVLSGDPEGAAIDLILTTISVLVPVGVVVAGWIGAALLDPHGRAPHDRLARSTVVLASDRGSAEDDPGVPS